MSVEGETKGVEAKKREWDWTAVYRKWDDIEREEEEKERREREERKAKVMEERKSRRWNRDRSVERRVFDLPWRAKLRGCRRFRWRGNLFYREGQFARAAVQYEAALAWYEYTFPESSEGTAAVDAERVSALCNLAACQLQLRKYKDAEGSCDQALHMDAHCIKALFRRAVARRHQFLFEGAAADLRTLHSLLTPPPPPLVREFRLLRAARAVYRKRKAQMSKSMFQGEEEGDDDNESVISVSTEDGRELERALEDADGGIGVEGDPDDDAGSVTGPTTDELVRHSEQFEESERSEVDRLEEKE